MLEKAIGSVPSTAQLHLDDGIDVARYWEAAALPRLAHFDVTPPLNNHSVIDETHRRLEDEVAALKRVMASFNARINALLPVSRLPPELLVRIFRIACSDNVRTAHADRVTITHTCQRWRYIALGAPAFWKDVDFAVGTRWATEILRRTGTIPISIRSSLSLEQQPLSLFILDHLPHARELDLQLLRTQPHVPSELCRWMTTPAPVLERLRFCVPPDLPLPFLPPDLFQDSAPRLRSIELSNVQHTLWASPLLTNVTFLSVTFRAWNPPRCPSLHIVLDALQQMPALEELALRFCIPSSTDEPRAAAVDLPQLKRFVLVDKVNACTYFMQHLRLPPTVQLSIDVMSVEDLHLGGIPPFLSAVAAHLGTEHDGFASVRLLLDYKRENGTRHAVVCLEAWRSVVAISDGADAPPPDVTLCFSLGTRNEWTRVVFGSVLPALQTNRASLRVLDVFGGCNWDCNDWLWDYNYWGQLRPFCYGVRTLCARGTATTMLCEELELPDAQGFFCPSLSSLTFVGTRGEPTLSIRYFFREHLWQSLVLCLKERRLGNVHPVENVCMKYYEVDPEVVRKRKKIIRGLSIVELPV